MTLVLQVSLYGLVMLGSIMLAYAEGTGFPDALTVPLAILALFLTERWKLFWLRTRWANCLGLLAFALGAWEFSRDDLEARLLSLAHVLVYLTWVVLFLEKSPRLYWTMCTLAVLHVAVGAVLTSSGFFGVLLVSFVLLSVWTLSIFTLSRARQRYDDELRMGQATPPPLTDAASETAADWIWHRRSQPQNSVQLDSRQRWISGPFVAGVFANVLLSGVVGAIFFLFTPRVWVGNFTAFGDGPDTPLRALQTGFAEEVQLGDIGQILEGTQTVLEVRLFDHERNEPLDVWEYATSLGFDEPLFRGSVLGEYANGRWRTTKTGPYDGIREILPIPASSRVVRQEIRQEPLDSGVLFAMPPHVAGRLDHKHSQMFERRATAVLYRPEAITGRDAVKYLIFSERPRLGERLPFPRGTQGYGQYRRERDYYTEMPERPLDRLQAFARQQVLAPDGSFLLPEECARRLEAKLKTSGEFGYTLDMAVDDPRIDAVEDFLFNRRRGHCEYFASALALMLRAVNIPARLVSGFKGGDLNPRTGYFVVQQRHAHVWVEAFLDGRWLVLDPTPASRSDSVKSLAPKSSVWNSLSRYFADLWTHRVVGLSMTEQNNSLYVPLKEWASETFQNLRANLRALLSGDLSWNHPGQSRWWLVLQGVVLALAVTGGVLIYSAVRPSNGPPNRTRQWLIRLLNWILPRDSSLLERGDWRGRLAAWWSHWMRHWRGDLGPPPMRVEFYERFLRVARSAGLEPLPTQTARELAAEAQARWSGHFHGNGLSEVPRAVAAQFYRVRFGGESLSADELRRLDQQIAELEEQCRRDNGLSRKVTPR